MKDLPPLQKLIDSTLKLALKERLIKEKNKMSSKIIEALKGINYKDLATRALWTFAQAFLAVFLVTSDLILDLLFTGDWTGLYALLVTTSIAAVAAGLSALKTVIVGVVKELKNSNE